MAEHFDFTLVFSLPDGTHDPFALSDAVFAAGYADAVIGTGNPKLLSVEMEAAGDDAESVILTAARAVLLNIPRRSKLLEVRPDLVSLAQVEIK